MGGTCSGLVLGVEGAALGGIVSGVGNEGAGVIGAAGSVGVVGVGKGGIAEGGYISDPCPCCVELNPDTATYTRARANSPWFALSCQLLTLCIIYSPLP